MFLGGNFISSFKFHLNTDYLICARIIVHVECCYIPISDPMTRREVIRLLKLKPEQ